MLCFLLSSPPSAVYDVQMVHVFQACGFPIPGHGGSGARGMAWELTF